MDEHEATDAKTTKPHAVFDTPHDVVADPELSKDQKKEALDALEQDARQLAVASAEGMSGGEPTGLQDVLDAKSTLEQSPTAHAYQVVLKDLRDRVSSEARGVARSRVAKAIAALEAVGAPVAAKRPATDSIGDPKPGTAEEVEAELALERLDPG